MKRIAFLSFDWDYKIVSEYYLGLQKHLTMRRGVQVVIFNAFGNYYASHLPKQSTFEIFSLYNPADYDGLLIQGNRTWPPELRQKVVDKTVAAGKPVVSINYDLEGALTVGTNNYREEYELVLRVLRDHHCTKPAFVNGLKTSVEAQARAQGYRDACANLGITDARFYQANWQTPAGVITARKMLREPHDLPDVIFCCNDDLAVGVQQALMEAGVRVPEDVMIAGFDNRVVSQRISPRITTIDRDYQTVAATALDTIVRMIDGKKVPQQVFSPAKHIMAESCRYFVQADTERISDLNTSVNSLERFYETAGSFQSTILGSESLYAILENCEMFARDLDCPNAFISLNDKYLQSSSPDKTTSYGAISRLMARKGTAVTVPCDERHVYASYATRDILPPEALPSRPLYLVSPLRHNESAVGVVITEGVPKNAHYGLNAFFLATLASSIDAMQKRDRLEALNAGMSDLQVYDKLTGLFNRAGLEQVGAATYERLLRDYGQAYVTSVRLANLQEILDARGREAAEGALCETADIVRHVAGPDSAFAARYDDDLFVVVGHRTLAGQVEDELHLHEQCAPLPVSLSLDVKTNEVFASSHPSIDQLLRG